MHIAVSAEARSRANREFRAIATSNPFIPLHSPLPAVSPPPSSFRSSRFQFRPDPAEYISLPPAPNPPLLSLSSGLFAPLPSSFPASALVHPRVLFPSFFFLFFFSSSLSSPHDARRQLHDATNCSHVYRHIIIIRRESFHDSIIVRDLI